VEVQTIDVITSDVEEIDVKPSISTKEIDVSTVSTIEEIEVVPTVDV